MKKWERVIDAETRYFNEGLAAGKWKRMMMVGGNRITYEQRPALQLPDPDDVVAKIANAEWKTATMPAPSPAYRKLFDAAQFSRKSELAEAKWRVISGLGWSGQAVALEPMVEANHWEMDADAAKAPRLEYDFHLDKPYARLDVLAHVLPTFRLNPSMKLRVAVALDRAEPQLIEVPGSTPRTGGCADQLGVRRSAILSNRMTLRFPFETGNPGRHTVSIWTPDPGVVLDQIEVRITP